MGICLDGRMLEHFRNRSFFEQIDVCFFKLQDDSKYQFNTIIFHTRASLLSSEMHCFSNALV